MVRTLGTQPARSIANVTIASWQVHFAPDDSGARDDGEAEASQKMTGWFSKQFVVASSNIGLILVSFPFSSQVILAEQKVHDSWHQGWQLHMRHAESPSPRNECWALRRVVKSAVACMPISCKMGLPQMTTKDTPPNCWWMYIKHTPKLWPSVRYHYFRGCRPPSSRLVSS